MTHSSPGLDSIPTDFAAQDALSFDEELFDVSEEELKNLSELFPNYSELLFPVSCIFDSYRVWYFRGRLPNFNHSEARKKCALASAWLNFVTFP